VEKTLSLILIISILLLQSCELFYPEQPLGSIHVISVGLNYKGTGIRVLRGTINDTQEIEQCLASLSTRHLRTYHSYSLLQRGGAGIDEYDPPGNSISLPTKSNVLNRISALAADLTENDLTIFNFNGHGNDDGSLILASPNPDGKIILDENNRPLDKETLLSVTELLTALANLPGKQLLILDSCYSGSFVEGSGSSVSLIEKRVFLEEAIFTYFSSTGYSPSTFVLAATTNDNYSYETGDVFHKHGRFTETLLAGLGWDHETNTLNPKIPAMKKGVLTTDSLYAYVLENQERLHASMYFSLYQHPTISGGAYSLRLF